MSDGRIYWYSEDAAYVHRGGIIELGEEFGAAVLAAMQVLKAQAKLENDGGRLMCAFRTVSRNGFIGDISLTERLVRRAGEIGVLDDLEILGDARRFRCRISGWQADQEKAGAARRQARIRKTPHGSSGTPHGSLDDVAPHEATCSKAPHGPPSNGMSRCVTVDNAPVGTEQNRTEQQLQKDSLRSSSVESFSETVNELFGYWREQCGHVDAKLTRERRGRVVARLREGYTVEQVRAGIEGAARAAFVNEDGKRFDDLELICRSGSKLESFMGRKANGSGRRESASDLLRAIGGANE